MYLLYAKLKSKTTVVYRKCYFYFFTPIFAKLCVKVYFFIHDFENIGSQNAHYFVHQGETSTWGKKIYQIFFFGTHSMLLVVALLDL